MIEVLKKEKLMVFAVVQFLLLATWWLLINMSGTAESSAHYLFGAVYGTMAVTGGVAGLFIAHRWGFTKSVMGKAILMLSLGLLLQEFGQLVFSYYNLFLHIPIPYPSLADVGFFGTIPLYIAGAIYLAKVSGAQLSLKKASGKFIVILIPIAMLMIAYMLFLREYEFDMSDPIKFFLDFGYPFGQALYIAIALLIYTLSKSFLGGMMKNKILLLIIAFFAQFIADYNFLYQTIQGTWLNGGYGDYLYLVAYFMMTLGIIWLGSAASRLRE